MVIIFFVTVLLGLISQKSKLITAIQLIVCAIIFSFNTENPDYSGYYGTYYSIKTGGIYWSYFQQYDPLYKLLVYICNGMGLSFNGFRVIVFVICAILVISTVRKITNRVNLVISLYMLFPFVMDCIQIRNMLAGAVIVFSVRYLIFADNVLQRKSNIIRYTLCVIIASLFHYVSIMYLAYLIVLFPKKFNLLYKIGFGASSTLTVFFFLIGRRKSEIGYLNTNVSFITFIFLAGITVALVITLYYYLRKRNIGKYIENNTMKRFFRYLLVSMVFIPVLVFHFDMFRFIRNILLVFSSFVGYYISKAKTNCNRPGVIIIPTVVITFAFVVCYGLLLWRSAYYPYNTSLVAQIMNSVVISW